MTFSGVFLILEALEKNNINLVAQYKYIQSYYGFDDAYFIYRDMKIYVSSLENQIGYFIDDEAWYELSQAFIVLCFVRRKPPISQYYERQENLYQSKDIYLIPFTWLTSDIIYYEGAGLTLAIDNNYYSVFSVGKTVVSFVKESEQYLTFGGGDAVVMIDGETKRKRDGKAYKKSELEVLFPTTCSKFLVYMLKEGSLSCESSVFYCDSLFSNPQTPVGQQILVDMFVRGATAKFTGDNIEYIQGLRDAFCGNRIKNSVDAYGNENFKASQSNISVNRLVYGFKYKNASIFFTSPSREAKLSEDIIVYVAALPQLDLNLPKINARYIFNRHIVPANARIVNGNYSIEEINRQTEVWFKSDDEGPFRYASVYDLEVAYYAPDGVPQPNRKIIVVNNGSYFAKQNNGYLTVTRYIVSESQKPERIDAIRTTLPLSFIPTPEGTFLVTHIENYSNIDLLMEDPSEVAYFRDDSSLVSKNYWKIDKNKDYSYSQMATGIIQYDRSSHNFKSQYERGKSTIVEVYAAQYDLIAGAEYQPKNIVYDLSKIDGPYFQLCVRSLSLSFEKNQDMGFFQSGPLVDFSTSNIESYQRAFFSSIPNINSLNYGAEKELDRLFPYSKKINETNHAVGDLTNEVSFYYGSSTLEVGGTKLKIDLAKQQLCLKNTEEKNNYGSSFLSISPNTALERGIRTFEASFDYGDYFFGLQSEVVVNQFVFSEIDWIGVSNFSLGSQQKGSIPVIYRSRNKYVLPKNLPKYKSCAAVGNNEKTPTPLTAAMLDPRLIFCDIFRPLRNTLLPLYIKNQDQDYFIWQPCNEFQSSEFYIYCDKPIQIILFLLTQ
jgi:hypothetical protein